jgi:hypothetical protein
MITESPVPGKFKEDTYPLEDNKYPQYPWYSQNNVDLALRITYCDSLGLPPIDQKEILSTITKNMYKKFGTNFAIAGTNGFGLRIAGVSNYDLFGELSDDGEPTSHNLPANDADFHVLTFDDSSQTDALDILEESVKHGAETMVSVHPSIKHLTPYEVVKSEKNAWGNPPYISLKLKYFRYTPVKTMEVHSVNLKNGRWDNFWNNCQPSTSNLIGSPIYLGLPEKTGRKLSLTHHIYNPFPTESKWQEIHTVGLTSPREFGDNITSVPQSTRVMLDRFIYSMATGVPAVIDSRAREIMKGAIAKWAPELSDEQRKKAQKRLDTMLHRAKELEKSIDSPISELNHVLRKTGNFLDALASDLDSIHWGVNVLGISVEKYLKNIVQK